MVFATSTCIVFGWNQKFLDYEIETNLRAWLWSIRFSWNQKFLDYEIETRLRIAIRCWRLRVGIKSFSITRLKQMMNWSMACELDILWVGIKSFSITRLKLYKYRCARNIRFYVGIKSFSITRLKHVMVVEQGSTRVRWNQKFLDYEIETDAISGWVDRQKRVCKVFVNCLNKD